MKCLYLLLSLFAIIPCAFTQSNDKKDNRALYSIGYRNIVTVDSTRRYKPNVGETNKFYYRPLEIDCWYPIAHPKSDGVVQYGEYLHLLEQRSNRFQDDTLYNNLSSELVQYLCINLKIQDTLKILHEETRSYRNAEAINERFPLIIYMSAYNGMSYENVNLFEWLASHGYVVACITSVGRYPGNMSTHPEDLMEQVLDGSSAISNMKARNNIDSTRIGCLGYSWGGLAALLLAMNNPDIKAVLSFDGSEMHYYGESNDEDKDFDELRRSPFFKLNNMKVPYTYLESGNKQIDRGVDSIFNILPFLHVQKHYIHFPKATHEDFSGLATIAAQISGIKNKSKDLYGYFNQFSLDYFNQYLIGKANLLPPQLSSGYGQFGGDSLYPVRDPVKINEITLGGIVIDAKNKEALAFVNVGVPQKNKGTVTQHDGSFLISFNRELSKDSLKISIVGYQSKIYKISDLLKLPKPFVIPLKEKNAELKEVIITTKALPTKIKGNTTTSNFMSVGLPLKFLGSETGIKIGLGKNPVLLKNFTFNISENRLDSAVFRLNIYTFKNGSPFENILQQNILVPVGKQKGKYTLNLTDYKLVLKGDVLVSLEWIEGSSSGKEPGAIFLSAGFLNSATWHRLTSQAEWKKANGIGVGFNILIQKLKM